MIRFLMIAAACLVVFSTSGVIGYLAGSEKASSEYMRKLNEADHILDRANRVKCETEGILRTTKELLDELEAMEKEVKADGSMDS